MYIQIHINLITFPIVLQNLLTDGLKVEMVLLEVYMED